MKRAFLILFLASISPGAVYAQVCGFDHKRTAVSSTPEFEAEEKLREGMIKALIRSKASQRMSGMQEVKVIPVVVHVLHTGGLEGTALNPSKAEIQAAITYLNAVFSGTLPGMQSPVDKSDVVDLGVRFQLATRSPNCGATDGINRINAAHLPNYTDKGLNVFNQDGVDELHIKSLAGWDPTQYYNIYLVNRIDGKDGTAGSFIEGFANFPKAAGAADFRDGAVILAGRFRENRKVIPHELGHALGLFHTFQGSDNVNQCPVGNGDFCNDTQPVSNNFNNNVYNYTCRTGDNTCTAAQAPFQQYNRNTEYNFMSYTNCATLFTDDQKARVDAAMQLACRQSLLSSNAFISCAPVINFLSASARVKEGAGSSVDDCRTYADYEYKMVIGAAPAADAVVTLSTSGTARRGADYEITTNGDFDNPSLTLLFPAHSADQRTFKVRVFDDFVAEEEETIQIDFTVNNNGGNASKGTHAPSVIIAIDDNDYYLPSSSRDEEVVIAGGALSGTTLAPLDARQKSGKFQAIYRTAELVEAGVRVGDIEKLSLYLADKSSSRPIGSLRIKLFNTAYDYIYMGSFYEMTGGTEVYSSASYSTEADWNSFTFTSPFHWDGGNLGIEICYDNGAADVNQAADIWLNYADQSENWQIAGVFTTGGNCSDPFYSFSFFSSNVKPVIAVKNVSVDTPLETSSGVAIDGYIPEDDEKSYFYSGSGKLVAGLRGVSGDLGCVEVGIEEGGTSWKGIGAGTRSAKVLRVSSAQGVTGISYAISLYFTSAELAGRDPAAIQLAKSSAASIANISLSNTVFVTPVVEAFGESGYIFSYTFTGLSYFFLYDASTPLPVNLALFSADVHQENYVFVQWKTLAEVDFDSFELQRSIGAPKDFETVATVSGVGKEGGAYSYMDFNVPSQSEIYYRLKMSDQDRSFQYSRVIAARTGGRAQISFHPNPVQDFLTITYSRGMKSAEIYSLDGRSLLSKAFGGERSGTIPVSGLVEGIYMLKLVTEAGEVETGRFIVRKE